MTANTKSEKTQAQAPLSVVDFFSVAKIRMDGWSALNNAAIKLANAQKAGRDTKALLEELEGKIDFREVFEGYWAYPGETVFNDAKQLYQDEDYVAFASAVTRITRTLMSGAYRRSAKAWSLTEEMEEEDFAHTPEYYDQRDTSRPYFEVLVVDDNIVARGNQQRVRDTMRRLRRPEDPFIYEMVFAPSFEDAIAGTLINHDLNAVVIYDYFPFSSKHDMARLRARLEKFVTIDPDDLAPESYGTTLADVIHAIRPELDIYLMTERSVEHLAGQAEAAHIRRIFYDVEELNELHLSILDGIGDRYETPHFSNLQKFARRPIGTFHALPIARGKSIYKSNWIQDMGHFYGTNLFLAETSTTSGGLDSLLEPVGTIKEAHEKAARAFGSDHTYFVTNGTSTANKIVVQAICKPGDVVLVDRNCHKSHHYGMVLGGAQPYYLDAYPLKEYSMYGAVPLKTIKKALLDMKAEGKLDKVRMVLLTNCTFDGQIYNVRRFMEECLAIKPDLIFLWDEAWFAFARFSPLYRNNTAMGAVAQLKARYTSSEYRAEFEAFKAKVGGDLDPADSKLLDMQLLPDPDKLRLRAYSTHSTHKSLSALRQGSMIHVNDEDYDSEVHEPFEEAFMTHTSTSPNAQIIASLDAARRQVELEGYSLIREQIMLAFSLRKEINDHPVISKYFHMLSPEELIPAEFRPSGIKSYLDPDLSWSDVFDAWERDEFVLDPTRLTLVCGTAGLDGTAFKNDLMDRYNIQLNKTSRNSVLFQSNINNTRSATSYVISTLAKIAAKIDKEISGDTSKAAGFQARVKSMMDDLPDLPNFSHFHDAYRDNPKSKTREGHMREAYFVAYTNEDCEHVLLRGKEIEDRLNKGPELVSANFVIPYPPGFPIMVPGQVITKEIINFMRELDVKEIHGYNADAGLKCIKPETLSGQASEGKLGIGYPALGG